jgi:peptidoglycan/xylan/chitin deacetylase (PgdA/CDA1 family)
VAYDVMISMTSGVLNALFRLHVHELVRWFHRRDAIVLAYHGFTDRRTHPGIQSSQGKHLHVDEFRQQLDYVKKHYNVVPLHHIVEHYAAGADLPPRALAITIDDGYESNHSLAFPLLREYGLPATIFLTTGFLDGKELQWPDRIEYALSTTKAERLTLSMGDESLSYSLAGEEDRLRCDRDLRSRLKRVPQEMRSAIVDRIECGLGARLGAGDVPAIYRPLDWRQVREMLASGLVSFGSHTVSHPILTRCQTERAREELLVSRRRIEDETGSPCHMFCYPNGRADCFSVETKALLLEAGYACGVTTVLGMNNAGCDVFELRRLYTDRPDLIRFILLLCGVMTLLDALTRRLRGAGRLARNGA